MNILNSPLAVVLLLTLLALACVWLVSRKRAPHFANIAEGTHKGNITKLADGAIATRFLLVEIGSDANHVAVCNGTTDKPLGVCTDEAAAAEDPVNVALLGSAGSTLKMVAAGNITAGDYVATTAAGKIQTAVSTQYVVGRALEAATADGQVIEVDPILAFAALA